MNLENPPLPCPRCGAPTQVLEDSEEPLLACTACEWRQMPIPGPRQNTNSGAFLGWLALGLLPIATPFVLGSQMVSEPLFHSIVVLGSAACCLVAGFGLASLTSAGPVMKLVTGLMAGVALAFVCLVLGLLGACATGVIRM